jgi:hypothetical protein
MCSPPHQPLAVGPGFLPCPLMDTVRSEFFSVGHESDETSVVDEDQMAADFVSLPYDVEYDYTDPRSVGVRLESSQDLPKSCEASFVLDWGNLCWYLHRKPPIKKEQISLINLASSQPYITKAYFSLQNPPTKLVKIAIGDGAIGDYTEYTYAPVV